MKVEARMLMDNDSYGYEVVESVSPLISVIIPVYNTEEVYMRKCLAPFMEHTEHRIEVVIVDDGSQPETSMMLHRLTQGSPNSIRIVRQNNGGQNAARNTGIDTAIGEYIEFLDSDDRIDWNSQLRVLNTLEFNKPDILGINIAYVAPDGSVITEWNFSDEGSPVRFVDKTALLLNCSALWQQLVRRDLFQRASARLLQGIYIGEDLASIVPLILFADNVATLGEPLYQCVMRTTSITHDARTERLFDIVKAFQSVLQWMQDHDKMEYLPQIEYLAIKHIRFAGVARAVEWEGIGAPSVPKLIKAMNEMFPDWQKNEFFRNDPRMHQANYCLILSGHYAVYDAMRQIKHALTGARSMFRKHFN